MTTVAMSVVLEHGSSGILINSPALQAKSQWFDYALDQSLVLD